MRALIILISILSLSGCISMDALTSSDKPPADNSYYLIDTKYRFLCLGNSTRCYDMTKVVSSRTKLRPIEKEYGAEVKGPNYPVSLMRIVMNPADKSYKALPVGNEGRYFKIPKNEKTNVVWETLSIIQNDLFTLGN